MTGGIFMKLYIAYGSNLNVEQMKHRCPTAKPAGIGILENCTLDFRRMTSQAYATIHPQKGSYVPVAFWEIDTAAEQSLDIYEGYPQFYYKETLPFIGPGGEIRKAIVYVMNNQAVPGFPSRYYVQTIYQGYRDMGLSEKKLADFCEKCGFSLYSML